MRRFGGTLALLGLLGFFYASSRVADLDPLPDGASAQEVLREPAGRWTVARYVCAIGAGLGLLLLLFPKGR